MNPAPNDRLPLPERHLELSIKVRTFVKTIRIMTTKLTLTVEKSIIERAKFYAKSTGRSLSELIETYLETITSDSNETELSPKLKKIVGVVNLPQDFDEETVLRSAMENKHL